MSAEDHDLVKDARSRVNAPYDPFYEQAKAALPKRRLTSHDRISGTHRPR